MISVEEFRRALANAPDAMDIVDAYLLTSEATVSRENIVYVRQCIAAAYGGEPTAVEVVITGSAKLGFSLTEKRKDGTQSILDTEGFLEFPI